MIYLYLKTHNVTGLKYLGKTEQDPYKYRGSGTRWKAHLKKHGHDITTEVLFKTEDKAEFKKVALEYSNKWNIVESADFANRMLEEGQGGVNSGSFKKGHKTWNKGRTDIKFGPQSPEHIEKRVKPQRKAITVDGVRYECTRKAHEATGIPISTLDHYGRLDGRDNVNSVRVRKYNKDNIMALNKMKQACPHCGAKVNFGNLKRWHLDNCKHKP